MSGKPTEIPDYDRDSLAELLLKQRAMLEAAAHRELAMNVENQALRDSADNVLCAEIDRWNEGLTALEIYLHTGLNEGREKVEAESLIRWLMDLYGYAATGMRPEWLDPALSEEMGEKP